jgi:hypothetical protein
MMRKNNNTLLVVLILIISLVVSACDKELPAVEPSATLPLASATPSPTPIPTETPTPEPTATRAQPTVNYTATVRAQVVEELNELLQDNSVEGHQAVSDYLAESISALRGLEYGHLPEIRLIETEEEFLAILEEDYPLERVGMITLEALAFDNLGLLDITQIEEIWGGGFDNMFKIIISLDKDTNFIYHDAYEIHPDLRLLYYLLWNSKALIHQNWEIAPYLGNFYEKECFGMKDECLSEQAVLYGDMIYTTTLWIEENTSGSLRSSLKYLLSQLVEYGTDDIVYAQNMAFVSRDGLSFVQEIVEAGGFEALNEVYENPPVSSEQIFHPERYPDDRPVKAIVPNPGPDFPFRFDSMGHETLGELYLFQMLTNGFENSSQLRPSVARAALEGWGGDTVRMFLDQSTMDRGTVLRTIWDSPEEMVEARASFEAWLRLRLGEEREDGTYRNERYGAAILDLDEKSFILIITTPAEILPEFIRGFDPAKVEGW